MTLRRMCLGLAVSLIAFAAQAEDLSGKYRIEGRNATGSGTYTGEVQIVRTGEAYQLRWLLQQGGMIGMGVVLDKILSVTFQGRNGPAGIAAFRINGDGSLAGIWAEPGGKALGTETWIPADRS